MIDLRATREAFDTMMLDKIGLVNLKNKIAPTHSPKITTKNAVDIVLGNVLLGRNTYEWIISDKKKTAPRSIFHVYKQGPE